MSDEDDAIESACGIHVGTVSPCPLCATAMAATVAEVVADLRSQKRGALARLFLRRLKEQQRRDKISDRFMERRTLRGTPTHSEIAVLIGTNRRHVSRMLSRGLTIEQLLSGEWVALTKPGPRPGPTSRRPRRKWRPRKFSQLADRDPLRKVSSVRTSAKKPTKQAGYARSVLGVPVPMGDAELAARTGYASEQIEALRAAKWTPREILRGMHLGQHMEQIVTAHPAEAANG